MAFDYETLTLDRKTQELIRSGIHSSRDRVHRDCSTCVRVKPKRQKSLLTEILEGILFIQVFYIVYLFCFIGVQVSGTSMLDTLQDGDRLYMMRMQFYSDIEYGDIIVTKHDEKNIIKRIIGKPGDSVEIRNNLIYVNDIVIKDDTPSNKVMYDMRRITLSCDEYFVLGDNRANSLDSRSIGPIKEKDILALNAFRYFPFDQIGVIN